MNAFGIPLGYPTFDLEYLDTFFLKLEMGFKLISDIIDDAPEDICYDLLKRAVINRLSLSRTERIQHFLHYSSGDDLDRLSEEAALIHNHSDRSGDRLEKLELLVADSPRLNRRHLITPKRHRSPSRHDGQVYYYHRTYGDKARRCRSGCKYAKSKSRNPSGKFHVPHRLLYVVDRNSELKFLVDTGSEVFAGSFNLRDCSLYEYVTFLQVVYPTQTFNSFDLNALLPLQIRSRISSTATPHPIYDFSLQLHGSHVFQTLPCPSLSPDSDDPRGYSKAGCHNTIGLARMLMHFVFAYIDDVLIASSNSNEHKQHLRQVFERLQQYGITVSPEKCKFGQAAIDFLDHHIDGREVTPLAVA
nr:gag pol polyprotein [Hymenolepis microstoma]